MADVASTQPGPHTSGPQGRLKEGVPWPYTRLGVGGLPHRAPALAGGAREGSANNRNGWATTPESISEGTGGASPPVCPPSYGGATRHGASSRKGKNPSPILRSEDGLFGDALCRAVKET